MVADFHGSKQEMSEMLYLGYMSEMDSKNLAFLFLAAASKESIPIKESLQNLCAQKFDCNEVIAAFTQVYKEKYLIFTDEQKDGLHLIVYKGSDLDLGGLGSARSKRDKEQPSKDDVDIDILWKKKNP